MGLRPGRPRGNIAPMNKPHLIAATLLLAGLQAQAADEPAWALAGQRGMVRYVIVPADAVRDRAAYDRQLKQICEAGQTCFVNFYANPTGAPLAMPLPDEIEREATAIYRKSIKNASERFEFSCRLQVPQQTNCF
jgi:hypothetical protein